MVMVCGCVCVHKVSSTKFFPGSEKIDSLHQKKKKNLSFEVQSINSTQPLKWTIRNDTKNLIT